MPTRMTVSSSENTARNAPSMIENDGTRESPSRARRSRTARSAMAVKVDGPAEAGLTDGVRTGCWPVRFPLSRSTACAASGDFARRCRSLRWVRQVDQRDRTDSSDHVQRDRDELRVAQSPRRHEREVGEEASDRGARRVHRIQQRDPARLRLDVGARPGGGSAASACRPSAA